MARLALGLAGAAVGSMFGQAALGYALGSAIGGALDPTKTKTAGPRLSDLRVQGSSYGAPIPRVFGAMRIAGQVIWSGGIVEHEETQEESAKGGPTVETTSYRYTCSFAVLLCEGPVAGVRRIWADARIIWSAAENQAVESALESSALDEQITFYPGTDTQPPDASIEAALGVGQTPAFRGRALLVFEDFDLGPYGNRVPNIEVEVVAPGGAAVAELYSRTIDAPGDLEGSGGRSAPFRLLDDGATLQLVAGVDATNPYPNEPIHITTETALARLSERQWMPPDGHGTFNVDNPAHLAGGTADRNAFLLASIKVGGPQKWWLWIDEGLWPIDDWPQYLMSSNRWRIKGSLAAVGSMNSADVAVARLSEYTAGVTYGVSLETVIVPGGAGPIEDIELADGTLYVLGHDFGVEWRLRAFADPFAETPTGVDLASGPDESGHWLLAVGGGRIYRALMGGGTNAPLYVHEQATGVEIAAYTLPFELTFFLGTVMQVRGDLILICEGNLSRTLRVVSLAALAAAAESVGAIVADICAAVGVAVDVSALTATVPGYVRSRPMTARAALEPLQQAFAFDLVARGNVLAAVPRGGAVAGTVAAGDYLSGQRPELTRAEDTELPRRVVVTYRARSRQYQEGSQQHQRLTGVSESETVVELPMALGDSAAAQIAEVLLRGAWIEREQIVFQLGAAWIAAEPADRLDVELAAGIYAVRLTRVALQPLLRVECEAVVEDSAIYAPVSQGADIATDAEGVRVAGPTYLEVVDGPLLRDSDSDGVVYIGAFGRAGGWRGAQLQSSADGVVWHPEGVALRAAATGVVNVVPSAAVAPARIDRASAVEITLARGAVAGVSAAQFAAAPPALMLGAEVVAYRDVADLGGGRYRITHLLRGLRGTEGAIGGHSAGERCVVLDAALRAVAVAPETVGGRRWWRGATLGRSGAAEAASVALGPAGLAPLAVAHLAAADTGGGQWALTWVRRTRRGGAWRDAVDVPLAEARERYRVEVWRAGALLTETEVDAPVATVTAAADDVVRVAQLSEAVGPGHYAELTI